MPRMGWRGHLASWAIGATVLTLSGCSPLTAVDQPLAHLNPTDTRLVGEQIAGDRSSELLVLLAFSGGGSRAAAFAYGALEELAATTVQTENGPRPLAHEVDLISSVSGGSFTSAYFALRGERIFDEFEERFLRKDIEGALLLQLLRPINWARLLSATYGRSDLAAEYYAEHVFDDATFGDIQRPGAPAVAINATDLATGTRFTFTPTYFDLICADLARYPLSRGVAASSAVPILLSPITLESFAGTCGFQPPAWLAQAAHDRGLTRRKVEAREIEGYLDRHEHPYIHLVDGGIADNLGLRAFYDVVNLEGGPAPVFRDIDHPDVRQILIVSVDAATRPPERWSLERVAPSLSEVIDSVTSDQIDRYSFETLTLVSGAYRQWAGRLSTPERQVDSYFVEASFDAVSDPARRAFLNDIGTNFDLDDAQVDALIAAARQVLRESPELQAFLAQNRREHADAPPATAAAP